VRPAATATATPDSAAPTLRLETPDAERQGLAGVLRALVLAGVRPAPMPAAPTATASTATSAPESDRPLAEAPIPSPSRPAASAAPDDDPAPARSLPQTLAASATPAALDAPLARTAREHLAEQVFKPQELADYDRVMPLPLAAADLPTPARLAVASRRGGNGSETHFLRVDAELTRLGPVSLRLSGSDGGPLAITVIAAHRAAGEELAGELPDLVADLRRAGVEAAVRVAIGDADA
jgi:hypothetical protein